MLFYGSALQESELELDLGVHVAYKVLSSDHGKIQIHKNGHNKGVVNRR